MIRYKGLVIRTFIVCGNVKRIWFIVFSDITIMAFDGKGIE